MIAEPNSPEMIASNVLFHGAGRPRDEVERLIIAAVVQAEIRGLTRAAQISESCGGDCCCSTRILEELRK